MTETGTVERAFELARSGQCHNVSDVRSALKAEGFTGVSEHLAGPSIQRQLRALIQATVAPF